MGFECILRHFETIDIRLKGIALFVMIPIERIISKNDFLQIVNKICIALSFSETWESHDKISWNIESMSFIQRRWFTFECRLTSLTACYYENEATLGMYILLAILAHNELHSEKFSWIFWKCAERLGCTEEI